MITEKITTKKGQQVIFFKGSGLVFVVVLMTVVVRYKGAKIEQLKGRKNAWQTPKKNQVLQWKDQP